MLQFKSNIFLISAAQHLMVPHTFSKADTFGLEVKSSTHTQTTACVQRLIK